MKIVGVYSFNGGKEFIEQKYSNLLEEVKKIIDQVDAQKHKTKKSREKTMRGKILYSPRRLNSAFKKYFTKLAWQDQRVPCDYPTQYYLPTYKPSKPNKGAFREMDFIKEKLGIEVQFGKYAFMVYNVCAKMTIFHKLGYIDAGIEIVPIKTFADQMSTGVSYFEQFVWDLEQRGVADIDIPVLILGIEK
ncbi:MAG: restriction endonuclease [Planctomycetes bacterium]|nr:restriction endonuclease [Planctomycetota bacterium]